MDSVSSKLAKIIDKARLDLVMSRSVTQRRYAESVEQRAIRASQLIGMGDMTEQQAWAYFQGK